MLREGEKNLNDRGNFSRAKQPPDSSFNGLKAGVISADLIPFWNQSVTPEAKQPNNLVTFQTDKSEN